MHNEQVKHVFFCINCSQFQYRFNCQSEYFLGLRSFMESNQSDSASITKNK